MVQKFCTRKNLRAKKVQAKDFEIEKLKINILAQNCKIKRFKINKKVEDKIRTHKS